MSAPLSAAAIDLFTMQPSQARIRTVTDAFANLLGRPAAELHGRPLVEVVHQDDLPAFGELGAGTGGSRESRFRQGDGGFVYAEWRADMGNEDEWRVSATDTADITKLLSDRRDLRTRLDLAIGRTTAATWDLDADADRFSWEPQAAEVLGVAAGELPVSTDALIAVLHPGDRETARSALARLTGDGTTDVGLRVGEGPAVRHLSFRGRLLGGGAGAPTRAVGLVLDVTTEKALEEQLLRLSVSDGLTGIRNRRGFDQTLRGEWKRCRGASVPLSLLMVDLDHFKTFNDTHGHLLGDQALVAVARALGRAVDDDAATLARYGGEEFTIVLPETDPDAARALGEQLLHAVRSVALRQTPDWPFSASIGMATCVAPYSEVKAGDLLAAADRALYVAKREGRDRLRIADVLGAD